MKKAIVVTSFGSANLKGIKNSIEELINEFKVSYGDNYKVLNAFTSNLIRKKLKEDKGIVVLSLEECLLELKNEGYEEVYVKPLHVFNGKEIIAIQESIEQFRNEFKRIYIGKTLLGYENEELIKECDKIAKILIKDLKGPILFIGHGSKSVKHEEYNILIDRIKIQYKDKVFFGTLEGINSKDIVLKELLNEDIKQITIVPILMILGKHYKVDIVESNASWGNTINNNGIKTLYVDKGLLEYSEIRADIIKKYSFDY